MYLFNLMNDGCPFKFFCFVKELSIGMVCFVYFAPYFFSDAHHF